MLHWQFGGTRCRLGDLERMPAIARNDNRVLASSWQTPAEVLQMIRRMKAARQQRFAQEASLPLSHEQRRAWDLLLGLEKCALWRYYGVR